MRRAFGLEILGLLLLTSGCELLLSPPEIEKALDDANNDGGSSSGGTTSVGGAGGLPGHGGDRPQTGGGTPVCDDDDCEEGGAGGEDASGGSVATGGESSSGGAATGGMGGELPNGCLRECDCDADDFLAEGLCGGNDCDDHDDRVRPNQTLYFAVASTNPNIGFDYDCSDTLERDPGQGATAISCLDLDLLACSGAQGFHTTMPACGTAGAWGTCQGVAVLCSAVTLDATAIARCR